MHRSCVDIGEMGEIMEFSIYIKNESFFLKALRQDGLRGALSCHVRSFR